MKRCCDFIFQRILRRTSDRDRLRCKLAARFYASGARSAGSRLVLLIAHQLSSEPASPATDGPSMGSYVRRLSRVRTFATRPSSLSGKSCRSNCSLCKGLHQQRPSILDGHEMLNLARLHCSANVDIGNYCRPCRLFPPRWRGSSSWSEPSRPALSLHLDRKGGRTQSTQLLMVPGVYAIRMERCF